MTSRIHMLIAGAMLLLATILIGSVNVKSPSTITS
jgi:hypothetical protein